MRIVLHQLILTAVILIATVTAQSPDYTFMTQRSFTSSLLKSLGDAGTALAGDISMGLYNPSLFYSSLKNGRGAVAAGYGRDSLFNRHIMPVAFGYTSGKGAMGGYYRFLGGDKVHQNEMTVNFSGVLFENADVQGAVDMGINFRFEKMVLDIDDIREMPVERYRIDTAGNVHRIGTVDSTPEERSGRAEVKRFALDMGFFQPNFLEHLDFGLVLRNLLGYTWHRESPRMISSDSTIADSVSGTDTVARFDRHYRFIDEEGYTRSWFPGRYRSLLLGVVYRLEPSASISLFFPVDMELMGLFDRKVKTAFVFRGGASVLINRMVALRVGYAREPKTILEGLTSFKNAHVFTGGAGIFVSSVSLDFFLSQKSFGFTAGYRF
ncbi:MAG: hypothetical protein JW863_18055 [Chitinispirillaceae bacterium]|nr:hypothetical protein [Chitinispirillaceae bacterium]